MVRPDGEPVGWSCSVIEGDPSPAWLDRDDGWTSSGGVLTKLVASDGYAEPHRGARTRDEAVRSVAVRALTEATDQLAARRAPHAMSDAAAERFVEELVVEGKASFPRVGLRELRVERCASSADTDRYRAAALVEYPIALLRGDAANAAWERSRLVREARVLSESAADHLESGRWADAAFEAGRTRAALVAAGAVQPTASSLWEVEDDIVSVTVVPPLRVRPLESLTVAPRGRPIETRLVFEWTYELRGNEVPAAGVPVRFSSDLAGVVATDAATGPDGRAAATIRRVWSPPGAYTVSAGIDSASLVRAGARWRGPAVEASTSVHVVESGHGLSVCLEIPDAVPSDAAQVRAGFENRMSEDGYRLVPCGPDAGILATARLSVSSERAADGWSGVALLEAEMFDQTRGAALGSIDIVVEETSDRGRREVEVLVLKEVGRLLGVYLSGRTGVARP